MLLDLTSSTLDGPQLTQLTALIAEYRDIFALKPEELGRTGLVQHRINTGDHPPVRQRPYRVSDTQRGIIEEHVDDMLNRGIIQPSTSPWASPIILVKKKDGTDRFVVDFRRLNAVTRKDSFPLPRSFLGLANYYRRFIKDFSKIAAPLNKLLRKDQKFVWTDICEQAFETLKAALVCAPTLAFPDFKETFQLFTDASNEGIGATLGQIQDGK